MNLSKAIDNNIFKKISETASNKNQKVYVIGGYVRDYLLNRGNLTDIDFVTEGSGIELAKAVAERISSNTKINIFKRFGTAMIHHENIDLEFVGARKESYSKDSRKPFVEEGTLEDDQNRRDFTINALAISLNKENFGELIDPFNGIKDLEKKLIKTPLKPDITFSDDPLRMIRAIRFATQLNFKIDENAFKSIKSNAHRLDILSMERITSEFNKIMMSDKPSIGIKLLDDTNLLQRFLPELTALKGVTEVEGKKHKDNFYHTLEVVDNISKNTDNLWLRWAALLHDIGKARTKRFDKNTGWTFHSHEFIGAKMVYTVFDNLKLPLNHTVKYVQKMVQYSSRPIALIDDDVTDSALRRLLFDAGDNLENLFVLCKADITTKNDNKKHKFEKNFEYVEAKIKELEEKDRIRNFQPPITGNDIINTFEIIGGRQIGTIKEAIKEAILEGVIENSYESSYKYMLKQGKDMGLIRKK